MLRKLIVTILTLIAFVNAKCVHGSKTLVVYDDRLQTLDSYSNIFNSMRDRSYSLDFVSVTNETTAIELFSGELRLYDNIMIFPIKGKSLNKLVSGKVLLKFSIDGGNVLSVTSPEGLSDPVRNFLNQLGIYPSPKDHTLLDYFQASSQTIEVSSDEVRSTAIYNSSGAETFIFENSSVALIDNREQLIPILAAPRTSYASSKGKEPWVSGSQGHLVVGFQTLNNARAAWVGSPAFLDDQHASSNGAFVEELLKWTFNEKGVIRATGYSHSHADGTSYEKVPYKIKDPVIYEVGFSEWDGEKWLPFEASDIQFELKMIDPYYRLTLSPSRKDNNSQWYSTGDFRLPDHHGVFTFQVDYKRSGLSFITVSDIKAIRHLAHDEYPRSWDITNARVYLTGIFAVIFAWVIFVLFFITTSRTSKTISSEKKRK